MILAKEDTDVDRKLKYEPESITDITRGPEPDRVVPDPPPPLLFDLDADPCEQNDLASARPDMVGSMQSRLDGWFEEVEAERATIADIW
jgi:hypothetical protein